MSPKKYIVVGSGWFGTRAVLALEKSAPHAQITVLELGSKDYIDINMQTPRVIIQPSFGEKVYQPLSKIWKRADLVNVSEVKEISSGKVVATVGGEEKTLEADGIIVATGAKHSSQIVKDTAGLSKSDRIANLQRFRDAAKDSKAGVLVVGGGATGVEIAGEIATDLPDVKLTLINKQEMLLRGSGSQSKMHKLAMKQLEAMGVTVLNGDYIPDLKEDYIGEGKTFTTSKGVSIDADVVVMCVGASPNVPFAPAGAVDEKSGGLKVENSMVCPGLGTDNSKPVWALGDCTMYGGRGYYSVDPQIAALTASVRYYEAGGTVDGTPKKYKHKGPEAGSTLVSIGRKGGASTTPYVNKFMGKIVKGNDMALKFMYSTHFKVKV